MSRTRTALALAAVVAILAGLLGASPAAAAPGSSHAADLPWHRAIGQPAPGSTLITCDRSDERVEITAPSHLDPSCTWTAGFDVTASGATLDCRGALVSGVQPFRSMRGIHVRAPVDVPLSDVTVRNCVVERFLNGIHVEREGFRALTPDDGYDVRFSDIRIENVAVRDTGGVGIFVNGFVTDVHVLFADVTRTGSSGIYLDGDSRENEVAWSSIHENGWRENGPGGQVLDVGGTEVWWWGVGREGLSIDGSAANHVHHNAFDSNTNGAILVYKNCGEFYASRPDRHWGRFQGSDDNLIEANRFRNERFGVWIGSRMAENQYFMECSDPAYGEAPLFRYHEDKADDNTVQGNWFEDVQYGVRVEDDGATVAGNLFLGDLPESLAVVVGTKARAELLGRPVVGATVTGNWAFLQGEPHPYRWIPSQEGTVFEGNRSRGRPVGWCEGAQPWIGPWLFGVAAEFPVPEDPVPPPPIPPVVQPDCPPGT